MSQVLMQLKTHLPNLITQLKNLRISFHNKFCAFCLPREIDEVTSGADFPGAPFCSPRSIPKDSEAYLTGAAIHDGLNHPIQIRIRHSRPRRQTQPPLKQILCYFTPNYSARVSLFFSIHASYSSLSHEIDANHSVAYFIGAFIPRYFRSPSSVLRHPPSALRPPSSAFRPPSSNNHNKRSLTPSSLCLPLP